MSRESVITHFITLLVENNKIVIFLLTLLKSFSRNSLALSSKDHMLIIERYFNWGLIA